MPHSDPGEACALIAHYLPDLPFWPQLPAVSNLENMYIQISEGFPGAILEGSKIRVEQSAEFDSQLEKLFNAESENKFENYGISPGYASGLYAFLSLKERHPRMAKGQMTAPISFGLCITGPDQRGILYNDVLADASAKFLKLKAMWQENFLKRVARDTIIFLDEPYLSSLGSAFVAISNDRVIELIEEVFSGIQGFKGLHCCGSTDWSLLLKSSTDILSFDAYNYADSLSCYVPDVNAFIKRGSTIAWGIVPNSEDTLAKETAASLYDRLGEAIAPFTREGMSFKQLILQGLLTPSCGLASLPVDGCERALQMLKELSDKIRARYSP
jgi:hypothetical protein